MDTSNKNLTLKMRKEQEISSGTISRKMDQRKRNGGKLKRLKKKVREKKVDRKKDGLKATNISQIMNLKGNY